MDNKERAETWRQIAGCYEYLGTYSVAAADARRRADLLDPPKPEWPDGTIARIEYDAGTSVTYARWRNEQWEHANGIPVRMDSGVTKVEPILGGDEIAVKRPKFSASTVRFSVADLRAENFPESAKIIDSVADALEAAETDGH